MRLKTFLATLLWIITLSVSAQNWQTDFEAAKAEAQTKGRNIVLVFSGSDWCAPCIKLDKEVWSTSEFQGLAKDHFVMMRADFPRKKQNKLPKSQQQQNNQLAERYNRQGKFPLVILLDKKGKVLGKTGYKKTSPKDYFRHLTSFEH